MNNLFQVDAFTTEAFKGNPAAIYISDAPKAETWMQKLALEMNLSETAFIHPTANGYSLRWFTPTTEVDLCGHATLASAHALWEQGFMPADNAIHFQTRSGELIVTRLGSKIQLDFPADPTVDAGDAKEIVEAAFGTSVSTIRKARQFYLTELVNQDLLNNLKPNFEMMKENGVSKVIATSSAGGDPYDFISRVFAPGFGINEDPVTGAAHCVLAPYWAEKLNKKEFLAYQASARGGELGVRLQDDRVFLSGSATTVFVGQCLV